MGLDSISLVIRTLGELYVFIVILRFMLHLANADYYNPICQAVVRFTQAPIGILNKLIPTVGRIDFPCIALAIIVKAIIFIAIFSIAGRPIEPVNVAIYSIVGMLYALLNAYFYAVLGSVIISWVAPDSYHPAPQLIQQVTAPLYRTIGKVVPPIGGFDLSPIVIFLVITILQAQLQAFIN